MGGKQAKEEELDRLTGILKKSAAELRITALLSESGGGTLFLCDVDQLKQINDRHGHLAGDECLKEAAKLLMYMTRPGDIFGRRSGDEFLIFMPWCRDEEQAQSMGRGIEKRFGAGGRGKEKGGIPFTVTVAYAIWQPGETCGSMFRRAEEAMERRRAEASLTQAGRKKRKDHYINDVNRVRRELREQIQQPGAYCPDYETFKGIYHFLERGLIRSGQKACIILLTVVDEQGRSLLPQEKDLLMEELGENIGATLRVGDVYARYSSSQYLILVIDTAEGQADAIVGRIRETFLKDSRGSNILVHHCYELQPAKIQEARGDCPMRAGDDA